MNLLMDRKNVPDALSLNTDLPVQAKHIQRRQIFAIFLILGVFWQRVGNIICQKKDIFVACSSILRTGMRISSKDFAQMRMVDSPW